MLVSGEKFFDPFGKAFVERSVFLAAELRKFFQSFSLFRVEAGWDFHLHADEQITARSTTHGVNAAALETEEASSLGAGRDAHTGMRTSEHRNPDFSAERGNREGQGNLAVEVKTIPLEDCVLAHMNHNIEVACCTSPKPGFPASHAPEPGTLVDSHRDFELHPRRFLMASLAATGATGFFDDLTGALAIRTRLSHLEKPARNNDLSLSAAYRTRYSVRPFLGTIASTGVTSVQLAYFDLLLTTQSGFLKRDLEVITEIRTAACALAVTASEELFKDPRSSPRGPEDLTEQIEGIVKASTGR